MKIIIDRELLLEKLNKVYKFVPSKSIIPALDNIKFDVIGGDMVITAFNGEVQCKLHCVVKSKEDISFCVPAKIFVSTVRLLRENELTLSITEKKVEIKCGKSKYGITINTVADEFPSIKFDGKGNEFTMLQKVFNDYASRTSSFAGDDTLRPWMTGVNIDFTDSKEMFFTSATNFVLCRAIVPVISVNLWSSVTVPVNAVKKVCEIINTGEMNILHNDNIIMFSSANSSDSDFEITATCINDKYPNVSSMFNAERGDSFVLNVSETIDCVNRIKLYVNPFTSAINLNLKGSELVMSGADEDFGNDAIDTISVTNEKNVVMERNFNAEQISKIMGNIDEVEAIMLWGDKDNVPIKITGKTEFPNFTFLVTTLKA